MNVLLPWNMSAYLALNGFHPLYRAFANYEGPHRLIIPRHDISITEFQRLVASGVYDKAIDKDLWWLDGCEEALLKIFFKFYSLREINFIGQLPGDIEFLHTAPITAGNRPFVLHVESFLPFFTPFTTGPEENLASVLSKVKPYYTRLLRESCLALVSHRQDTLDQLSSYFCDSSIDAKLVQADIGVPFEGVRPVEKDYRQFIFTGSAHQNSNNFLQRGGYVSLCLAIKLVKAGTGNRYRFIFRAKKPSQDQLAAHGVDINALTEMEASGCLVWIETHLPDDMISRLYARSDYLLIPSCVLHSDAVLKAMMHGVIPIVTDAPGFEYYVDSSQSVVLTGVKDALYKYDRYQTQKPGIGFDDLRDDLVGQAAEKLFEIESSQELRSEMKRRVVACFNKKFTATKFLKYMDTVFESNAVDNSMDSIQSSNPRNIVFLGEDYIEDLGEEYFHTVPQPMKMYFTGHGTTRKILKKHVYIASHLNSITGSLGTYGPLNLWWNKYSQGKKKDFLFGNDPGMLSNQIFRTEILKDVTEQIRKPLKHTIAGKLRKYPRLYNNATRLYRYLRRVGALN